MFLLFTVLMLWLLSKNLKIKTYRTIILPVVLYGCETWSRTLREERKLRVFQNMVLRKIFGPRRDEVTGEKRRLHNEELNDLYSSPIHATCPTHLILLDFITRTILGVRSPPFPCYLVPPRSKYSPQYHIFKHPQLSFLPQCQRPSFTPIQNNWQNYSSISLNFWIATWN